MMFGGFIEKLGRRGQKASPGAYLSEDGKLTC